MVLYECFRCGYNTKLKGNMKHHLNRKNICEAIDDDVEIEEIKKYYGFGKNPIMTQKDPEMTPKNPKIDPIEPNQLDPKKPQKTQFCPKKDPKKPQKTPNEPICIYCGRTYSKMCHLRRHEKTCKKKKETETLTIMQNEEMIKMKKEIEELKNFKIQTQNNTTNNNTTNNNTTNNNINNSKNIIINNYGNENLKHLRSKDFANLLDGIYSAVPKLIEKIHFDPKHPENQNIKYTNQKSPYLKVMKDDKWQFVNKKHELLELIDNKCFMLKEKYYNILEKKKYNINDHHRDKIEKFIKEYNEEDKKMIIDLIERTELMLLNNS